MWEHIAEQPTKHSHGTVILCGPDAASGFPELGDPSKPSEIVTYHTRQSASVDGSLKWSINVFRVRFVMKEIIANLPFLDDAVLVFPLSWASTDKWTQEFKKCEELLESFPSIKLLITTSANELLESQPRGLVALDKSLDTCHQYLRTMAMKTGGALVYPADSSAESIEWDAVILRILGFPISNEATPPEQFYGSLIAIYDNNSDSKENILTIDSEFEFERAWKGELTLPQVFTGSEENQPAAPPLSFPEEFARTLSSYENTGNGFFNGKRMVPHVGDITDDKRVISQFFTTIAKRAENS